MFFFVILVSFLCCKQCKQCQDIKYLEIGKGTDLKQEQQQFINPDEYGQIIESMQIKYLII